MTCAFGAENTRKHTRNENSNPALAIRQGRIFLYAVFFTAFYVLIVEQFGKATDFLLQRNHLSRNPYHLSQKHCIHCVRMYNETIRTIGVTYEDTVDYSKTI